MKQQILIIAAMEDFELQELKKELKNRKEKVYQGFRFFEGELAQKQVVLCTSGVGLIRSAIATTMGIEIYHPEIIINEGLAGGYPKELQKGEIVIGVDSICITSMEDKGTNYNTLEDYELTNFIHGEKNRLIPEKADEELLKKIKSNFQQENIYFRKNWKW